MNIDKNDVYAMIASLIDADIDVVKDIKPDEDLMEYGMTSVSCIQLIVKLEEKYEFCFKDEDLLIDKLNTLEKIFTLLAGY